MEIIVSIMVGIGLAAACGFRVFVPLFLVSLLSHFGFGTFGLSEDFSWIGTLPAIITFGAASVVEIGAYYIPFIDNLLDSIAVPLATVAGTLITLSTMVEIDPLWQWSIALIAGGGLAGLISGGSAATRAVSSATTAGLANPVVSTVETTASVGMTFMAAFVPVLAFLFSLSLVWFAIRGVWKWRKKKEEPLTVA